MNSFTRLVRSGNFETAASIAQSLIKRDGFGLNNLHHLALVSKSASELGEFKAPSTTKKPLGKQMVFPYFCAAINPNPQIFQALHNVIDNKMIQDEVFSNATHYAAVCSSSGPLEILISERLPFDLLNKMKQTPLILAATFGRHANCEVLLKAGANWKKFKDNKGYGAIHRAV